MTKKTDRRPPATGPTSIAAVIQVMESIANSVARTGVPTRDQLLTSSSGHPGSTRETLLVGVDGCGGAGKSTFARALQQNCPDVTGVQVDDFHLPESDRVVGTPQTKPIGADFDWQRLRRQVLLPLQQNKPARYQRYDWHTDALGEWVDVAAGGVVVVEGVYCTREELREYYDIRVFVDCPHDLRIERGIARDGENARARWEDDWCPSEERYVESHRPDRFAHLIVQGAPGDPHSPSSSRRGEP